MPSDVIEIGDSNGYSSGANKCRSVGETATPSALAGATAVFKPSGSAARGNDVEMRRLSVVYANGNPDDLDVQRVIRSGSKTEALDLKGRDRAIERIDMTYRQRDDFRGRATVCVEGLVG